MRLFNALCLTSCVTLIGCSTLQIPKEVLIPVSVSCVKEIPIKGYFLSHDELKALNAPDYVLQVTAEYLKYESYTGELEAVLSGCK